MTEKNYYALFDKPTPQNLEANQRGRLTLEQQSALEQMVAIGVVAVGVILLVLFLSGGDVLFNLSRDDIENGQVESVIGKVAWTGRRYRMVSDSRKLKSLQYGRTLPPPGDYRFYCLPESGLVLMAEELGVMSVSQPKDLLLDALARANHFSMDDLQVNRDGSLSHSQELRLLGLVSVLIALILITVLGVALAVQGQFLEETPTSLVLIGVIVLILSLRLLWSVIVMVGDMWVGRVNQTDGQVTRHVHRARNTRYYTYQVNGFRFRVSMSAYNALIEGREYRIYFAPRSKRLVAIEPI
jgi:hypothetical protein